MTRPSAPLADFERWLALDSDAQQQELKRLEGEDPIAHAQLVALILADQAAEAGGFLKGTALADASSGLAPEVEAVPPEARIGPWSLERPIGSGGTGQVWLARRHDGHFEGQVAIKMLHETLVDRQASERFASEGRILARLAHPNIARLLDVGTLTNGRRYLVLEYVEGERIDRYCDQRGFDVRARLEIFRQVCAAVEHAHANLVVHRDLKPDHILVMPDGQVKLLDFGVAKLLDGDEGVGHDSALTRLAAAGLTPEYAAPEQIEGGPITTATDVYALGMVLYRLLGGGWPYPNPSRSAARLARDIVEVEARPLSSSIGELKAEDAWEQAKRRGATPEKLRRQLRGDLDQILDKSLRKEPSERYVSARALLEDIECHLANRPVSAHADHLGYRLGKYLRRHRLGVAASLAVLIAVVSGVAGVVWQARLAIDQEIESRRQARVARAESAKATALKDFLLDLFRASSPAAEDLEKARRLTARELLDLGAKRIENRFAAEPELREEVLDIIGELYYGLGEHHRALELAQQRVAVVVASQGPDSRTARDAFKNLSFVLQALGDRDGAAEVTRRFGDYSTPSNEVGVHDQAWALTSRARQALPQDPVGAAALAEEALRRLDQVDHLTVNAGPRRLAGLALADALALQDRFDEALTAARAALSASLQVTPVDTPVIASVHAKIGQLNLGAQALAQAEGDLARAYTVISRRLGSASTEALVLQAQSAALAVRKGPYRDGLRSLRAAERGFAGTVGENGPEHFSVRLDLAQALYQIGDFGAAEVVLHEILPTLRGRSELNRSLAQGLILQSRLSSARGKVTEATATAEQAAALLVLPDGTPLPSAALARTAAAEALTAAGRLAEARATLDAGRQLGEAKGQRFPAQQLHRDLAAAEMTLWRGMPDTAQKRLRFLVDRLDLDDERQYHGELLARALLGLGRAQTINGELADAQASLSRALELQGRLGPPDSPWLATIQVALADCLISRGQTQRAAALIESAAGSFSRHAPLGRQFLYPLAKVRARLPAIQ